ncbi:hypothetical protein AK812_SmicGene40045 [Symbiodinium microadriaticum]|uniref:Uncharacterized protein n=1 Tax=Symbiodinium microadriaticum TaxID=2951 RepID=A0A1Q9C9R3_SYMMI|nr:hypothetical protein AK812_SmicGene40045 [Symbiodinium microadriaticum]
MCNAVEKLTGSRPPRAQKCFGDLSPADSEHIDKIIENIKSQPGQHEVIKEIYRPSRSCRHSSIEESQELPILNFGEQMSEQPLVLRFQQKPVAGLLDAEHFPEFGGQDVFVFCQAEPAGLLKNTKSRVYFISIPDAVIIEAQGLDFTVLQLMAGRVNEKHRDVIAVGHRSGNMMIAVMIARIYFNTLEDFGDLFLTPGLAGDPWALGFEEAVSEHLFNKSFIMVRKYPVDWLEPREPELYPPILMEDWCPADCQGTVTYKSPYTPIFNKEKCGQQEPRIPLSLAAPALVYARFSMEAVTIDVKFDRATLRGALPLDTTNDIVPDIIDYTTQLTGDAWDCANTFDEDTVILLGPFPETSCKWAVVPGFWVGVPIEIEVYDHSTAADDLIQISLPRLFDIQVGDQIFLQADTIYTIPRPQDNEYSMAAQGGIAISLLGALPDPLEEPVVIITGTTEIDECSPLQLSASDSYFLGGQATYRWELLSYRDLTNNPAGRIFNRAADQLRKLGQFNDGQVVSPPNYLEEAVGFMINLTVTSRWGLSKSELVGSSALRGISVEVTKLDFPAPMVSILGPKELLVNRPDSSKDFQPLRSLALTPGVYVTRALECSKRTGATVSRQLGYRWSETTGQLAYTLMVARIRKRSGGMLVPNADVSRRRGFMDELQNGGLDATCIEVYTTRSLVIPPFVLEPIGSGSDVLAAQSFGNLRFLRNMYNFTVETFAVDNPSKAAYASVTVRVRRSPVFAALATEDRLMTRGDILVLDARQSQEQRGGARDFNKRDCAFSHCLDPDYPTNPGMTFVGTFTWWGRLPCFGSNGTGLIPPLETCITDFDSRIVQGGMTFSLPLFDEGLYCRWVEFSGRALDTRRHTKGLKLHLGKARGVLMVSTVNFTEGEYLFEAAAVLEEVQAQANDGRRSSKISISGTVESELDPTVELEFSWRGPWISDQIKDSLILVFSSNPLYDGDLAREAESDNDPTTVYLVDKRGMVYIDQTDVYDVTNASRFFTRPDSPNMIIKVSLQTAGLPPRSGTLISAPLNATMDTKRVISAPDWVANDLPLNYQFGSGKREKAADAHDVVLEGEGADVVAEDAVPGVARFCQQRAADAHDDVPGVTRVLQQQGADAHDAGRVATASWNGTLLMLAGQRLMLDAGRVSLASCNFAPLMRDAGRFSLASCNIAPLMLMMLAGFRLLLATLLASCSIARLMLMMLAGFACFLQHRPADAHDAGRFSVASCNIARLMLMMLVGFRLLLATSPGCLDPITVRLNTAPQRVQQIEVEELPIGEPSTGFSLCEPQLRKV